MPSRISCWMRVSPLPAIQGGGDEPQGAGFTSILVSSRYSAFFPTDTFQICAFTVSVPISTLTVSGAPDASVQRVTGILYQSFSG